MDQQQICYTKSLEEQIISLTDVVKTLTIENAVLKLQIYARCTGNVHGGKEVQK